MPLKLGNLLLLELCLLLLAHSLLIIEHSALSQTIGIITKHSLLYWGLLQLLGVFLQSNVKGGRWH